MSHADILHFTSQALWLVLILSMPPVLVAALVGTLFATTAWLGNELYSFADMVLFKVPQIQ
ncbi:hypothetical protein AMS64_13875 [Aeromonas veronii]|uniref:EscS/YscS/HrcS family type III secretion system export apparatus protein n=1 Tax=Aeromonas veronii TaxID=654 RepID=UPI00078BBDA1|nr:hypothetical protein [Aeromonas veronii]AMQ43369.1 hypothetical protein AMS64_13875 [Aeromonas veronii]